MVALAGAIAEEEVLGSRSTGAAGDYEQVLKLVENMLASGMSSLGVMNVAHLNAEQRQVVTSDILNKLEKETKDKICAHKAVLLKVASILEEAESLDGEELRAYIAQVA